MGVFVGIQQMEYSGMSAPYLATIGPYSATGSAFSVAAGRLSFTYGLKGTDSDPRTWRRPRSKRGWQDAARLAGY
jgi:hypothetical protein